MAGLLNGKRALVMGVANDRSIAWGIAQALAGQGAELAFTYQGEAFGKRVEPLAASVGSDLLVDVDVTDDASLDRAFEVLADRWGRIDIVVHAALESDGVRRVREIVALPGRIENDVVEISDIFTTRDGKLVRADGYPPHHDRFQRAGYDVAAILGSGSP